MAVNRQEEADRLIETGHRLEDGGHFESALAIYLQATAIAPKYFRNHINVANAFEKLERRDEAYAALRTAIKCAPTDARVRFNLGAFLFKTGDLTEAETQLLRAAELAPHIIEPLILLADLYELSDRFAEADSHFARALALTPEHPAVLLNFGMFCMRQGRHDEASDLLLRAQRLSHVVANVESYLLGSLNFNIHLTPVTIAERHREIAAQIARKNGLPVFTTWSNIPDAHRRLRIGYISGDLTRLHPVALFLRLVLEHHDSRAVETFCYSNYFLDSEVARSIRHSTQHWAEISAMDDSQVVDLLRRDEIDILVDLSGHTDRNRLSVFVPHPAPVQVTWLGYLNTTGLTAMDYRLCDAYTDPEGETEHLHTERLVRMPHSQWCYTPWLPATQTPAGVPEMHDAVAFASFNQAAKISDECLRLWCQVLSAVPGSSLLLLDVRHERTGKRLLQQLERFGVDPARVTLLGRQPLGDYFATFARTDIALDTFPYNGATTTLDTLWMGVPVVAMRGGRGISRSSYSILKTLGADELIAYDERQYSEINVKLAKDAQWRAHIRKTLRTRLQSSPLMDASGFVHDLERAYRSMWVNWCTSHDRTSNDVATSR